MNGKTRFQILAIAALAISLCTACLSDVEQFDETINESDTKQVTIYFTDEARYAVGTEPYEVGVVRTIPSSEDEAAAILRLLFEGPTDEEFDSGLRAYLSGCTGFSGVDVSNGIARVYLTGDCNSQGATYTIASLIFVNLKLLDQIDYVKIYDQTGETETPEGPSDSIPVSLEP